MMVEKKLEPDFVSLMGVNVNSRSKVCSRCTSRVCGVDVTVDVVPGLPVETLAGTVAWPCSFLSSIACGLRGSPPRCWGDH